MSVAPNTPKVGAIWHMGAHSAQPGRLVVVAGRVPTGGHFVMFALERVPDVRVNDIPVDAKAIRWFEPPESVRTVVGALPMPIASDDLERRVAVVRSSLCDAIEAALRHALIPGPVPESVRGRAIQPSAEFLRNAAEARQVQAVYEQRFMGITDADAAAAPAPIQRAISWLRIATLRIAPTVLPQSHDRVSAVFRDKAGVPVASLDGRLGERQLMLVMDFSRLPIRVEHPVIVSLLKSDGVPIAEAEISRPEGRVTVELWGDPEAATRRDVTLEARQPRAPADELG